jgi:hypothetical protein
VIFVHEIGRLVQVRVGTGSPASIGDGLVGRGDLDHVHDGNTWFGIYRWHIMDPVRFDQDLRVTMQALGWRSHGRYLPMQDDIASVAFWYQTLPTAPFPPAAGSGLPGGDLGFPPSLHFGVASRVQSSGRGVQVRPGLGTR